MKVKLTAPYTFFFVNKTRDHAHCEATMRLEQKPIAANTEALGPSMLSVKHSPESDSREHGQVIVLVRAAIPVILAIGSVVVSVGNWYVLKRHLQTQVDAAALAAGAVAERLPGRHARANRDKMTLEALKYAGDTVRATRSVQPATRGTGDVRVVFNSTNYWGRLTIRRTDSSHD